MKKETESISRNIKLTKHGDDIELYIDQCAITFDGSTIKIDLNGISIQDNDNLHLINDNGIISIANESLRITLNKCAIKMGEGQDTIDCRGSLITFSKCTSENDSFTFFLFRGNSISKQWFQLQNISHSEISLKKSMIISAKNAHIQTHLDANKEFKVFCKEATFILPTDSKIELISGEINLLEIKHAPFAINLLSNTLIDRLIALNAEVCGIKPEIGIGSITSSNGTSFSFGHLHRVSKIKFPNNAFQFNSDSCDFSTTEIIVADTASLNVESIATIWNPMLITYRGFNPKKLKSTSSEGSISAARAFFCEMKTYFSGKGDSITAGDFHAAEMIAHRRYLQLKKDPSPSDRFDRLIMLVSHKSSHFGQSALRALSWYLALGLLFTVILMLLMGDMCARCFADWNILRIFDCNFFVVFLLNVLSPLNLKLADIIPTGSGFSPDSAWSMATWMSWKIIGGFLIFQIIASSRRFIRKW